jgi:hypothetical protein
MTNTESPKDVKAEVLSDKQKASNSLISAMQHLLNAETKREADQWYENTQKMLAAYFKTVWQ